MANRPDDPAIGAVGAAPRWPQVVIELEDGAGSSQAVPLVDLRSGRPGPPGPTADPDELAELAAGVLGLPDPPVVVVLTDDPVRARAACDVLEELRLHRRGSTGPTEPVGLS